MDVFSGESLTCIRGDRVVFTNLNFSIEEGEVLNLQGPNGSGKSTLLRLMAGLISPLEGKLIWNGSEVQIQERDFCIYFHYVGHQDAIKNALTVEENLRFWSDLRSLGQNESMIKRALDTFSLTDLSSLPARFLSAGQRKRLNLTRLCTTTARLWILDEPANSLDKESSEILNDLIKVHQKDGGILAIATHDIVMPGNKILNITDFSDTKNFKDLNDE
ncbi:MAG: heme ABC exporter ATP-binding protein CcmA [Rhodospirillales bacterium]|nr:heme ABC exporter ATP-binding protein CcmA [Rhodospirillales bacterium]